MSNPIKIAYHPETEKFIHIDNAKNGLACDCICLKCKERLEAKQGEIRTKHFSHHTNINCEGSQETALHEQAKQILVDNLEINIPGYGTITYSNPIAEKMLEQFRPDVTASYNGKPIYFEVYITHAVDSGKEKFLKLGKHRSLEINLSNYTATTFDEIKKTVLEEVNNKEVFYWLEEMQNADEDMFTQIANFVNKYWKGILAAGGIVLFLRYAFRRKK